MEDFNIKEAANELEKVLKKELGAKSIVRFTIDVQIPEYLNGDKQGFYNSILQICTYLNRYIIDLSIDIELFKAGPHVSEVRLIIDVRGSNPDKYVMQKFFRLRQNESLDLLKILPYPTRFFYRDMWACFSFSMTFSGQAESVLNLFRNKKVLLVEENELSALVFITFMEEWGCLVTKISDGLLVTEEIKRIRYNVVLINIHSPEMGGTETIRKIRKFDQHTPIIGLTSPWAKDDASLAYAAGANDLLAKPVSSYELKKILTKFFLHSE